MGLAAVRVERVRVVVAMGGNGGGEEKRAVERSGLDGGERRL